MKQISNGKILFNPSQKMKVGIKERIEVRIIKTIKADVCSLKIIYIGLKGSGIPEVEEIKVGTFMKVRLMGSHFDIKALSHEDQIITDEEFTQWDWDVIPLKSGIQQLSIIVTIRIMTPNFEQEFKDYLAFEKQILVKVNPVYSTQQFVIKYWQWIITTVIGSGIIGWLIRTIMKTKILK